MNFGILDWLIIVGFLVLTSSIALLTRKLVSNYDSFLLAGRNLKLYLAMATMGATELGLVTLMYYAQQGYESGFAAFIVGLTALAGFIFVGKTGFIIKGLRRLQCRTVAEFFGIRYNRSSQIIAALITFIAGMMNMGMFLVMGAKFMLHLVGLTPDLLPYIMIGLLCLVLIYTVVGGMISVVFTDYIQFILLFTGVLLTSYFAVTSVGYGNVIDTVQKEYGEGGFNPFQNEDLGWLFILWFVITALFSGMWPPAMSRALSTTSSAVSQKLYSFIGLSFLGRALLPMLWGICAFVFFAVSPEINLPTDNGTTDTAAAMPAFLSHILPTGVMGLLLTGALAAMMSTFDSYLLCWSSIFVNDVIVPLRRTQMTDQQKIKLTRIAVVCCGIIVLLWGYLYDPPKTILRFMTITGTMYSGSVLLTIAMGLYWKKANAVGTISSLIIAGTLPLSAIFIKDSSFLPYWLEWLAEDKIVGIATYILSFTAIVVGSLLTQRWSPPKPVVYTDEEQ